MTTSLHGGEYIPRFELKHRVKLARECAGLQQGELAEIAGLSRAGIAKIERGETAPRRSSLMLIALATGVNREWLETGKTPDGGTDGGEGVRHQGLEPRTHWLGAAA